MLRLLKVSGQSLTPEFQEGDFVLVVKIPFFFDSVRQGDIVVFRHPEYGTMIKRVSAVDPINGEIFVTGSHPFSVDSTKFGAIQKDALIGKVIWHIVRPKR